MMSSIKKIERYEKYYSPQMIKHITDTLDKLEVDTIAYINGKFVPGNSSDVGGNANFEKVLHLSDAKGNEVGIVSIHPALDDRRKDVRLKASWERGS